MQLLLGQGAGFVEKASGAVQPTHPMLPFYCTLVAYLRGLAAAAAAPGAGRQDCAAGDVAEGASSGGGMKSLAEPTPCASSTPP